MKKTYLFTSAGAFGLALALATAPAYAADDTTASPAAAAQDQGTPATPAADESSDEDIVVTGSLLRQTDKETASPVTVLTSDTLEQRGLNTVSEAVQRVSAGNAGNITQGWNTGSNFATGANAVSLRGLTVQSTLTIFDGLRMAPYPLADDGHRNFVDLNTIPDAIVDRIEVLRDGASSTYGADAVAGVINVITKKQVTGLHINGSAGISQEGDAGERRIDATFGYGDLADQGFNFYVNAEYQRSDALYARDRGYPFNTSNLHNICNSNGFCLNNGIQNSVYTNNLGNVTFNGLFATQVPTVRAVNAAGAVVPGSDGVFHLLNAAAGCRELTPVSVPVGTYTGLTQCSRDTRALYSQLQPDQERLGFSGRFTAEIGDRVEFYAAGSYYQVKTATTGTPSPFTGNLPPPNPAGFLQPSNLYLPVYVCSTGVGSRLMDNTGCNAGNGVLNPQNPYAAQGLRAQILATYDKPRLIETKARSLRGAAGINGSFGDDWRFSVEATASQVQLDVDQVNYVIPQHLWNAIAQGTYNFFDPSANTQEVRDYVAPLNSTRSTSDLWQVSGTLAKDLFQLPGGPLQVLVGVSYRHESIDNPSANPENLTAPYDRYFVANAVGAVGSRNVKSAYYEISAPVVDMLELSASGRYDKYSSGQTNFSPKFGAKFKPVKQLLVRGTWSKGFRIPSFNEAYGLPTTGYITLAIDCGTNAAPGPQADFCKAHSTDGTINNANTYATNSFPVGLTATGNPALDPEKSTSWTLGAVFEPIRNLSFTVDYWNIKVKDIIGGADYSAIPDLYYANNGNVNVPGITVLPGTPDVAFPNALPQLGFIQYSFQNNDSEKVSGVDFGANFITSLFSDVRLSSSFEASYLIKFAKMIGGVEQRYDGTLSPCDVTSCSGAPKWRGSWQNTFEIGNFTTSVTAYYTSGYDLASIDYGGVKGDCAASIGASVVAYPNSGGVPVKCKGDATWNVDLSMSYRINDHFKIYGNVLNVLGIDAPFDPSAAYSIFQFNPSWAMPNILGRYFRVGAKVDF